MSDKHFSDFMAIIKYLFLLELGGIIYYSIEVLWRGYSHWTMFILGGVCLCMIGSLNTYFSWDMYMELQIITGDIITLTLELITGCIVNIGLGWHVWDYSDMPGNIVGQICPQFAILWLPIVTAAILLDDYIRYKVFYEEKPHYNWFIKELINKIKENNHGNG